MLSGRLCPSSIWIRCSHGREGSEDESEGLLTSASGVSMADIFLGQDRPWTHSSKERPSDHPRQ